MSEQSTQQFPAVPDQPPDGRRRAWRIIAVAALSVLVLLLPVLIFLVLRSGREETPAPGDAAPSAAGPSPAQSSPPLSRAPDGHISLETLKNSTVTMPPWPADNVQGPSGPLHFRDGVVHIPQTDPAGVRVPPHGSEIILLGVTYGDVDRDGSAETIAEYACLVEGAGKQLVALDRSSAGRIVTLGQVVATTGEIRDIRDDSVRLADGVVTVRVGANTTAHAALAEANPWNNAITVPVRNAD